MSSRLVLLGLLGLLLALLAARLTPWHPTDDAYISYRYALSWAKGHGPVFNPGERVEGYSNFLYVAMLAGATRLGVTPPLASRLFNTAGAFAVVLLLLYGLPRELRSSKARYLVALTFVVSAYTVANVLSGLESPIVAALVLGGALALENRRVVATPLCFLAISLERPDGAVLAAIAGALDLGRSLYERDLAQARRVLFTWFACAGLPYLAYTFWRVHYFGHLLPNSVYAKMGFSLSEKLRYSLQYLQGARAFWPLALLAIAGWAAHFWRQRLRELWSVLVLFLAIAAISIYTAAGDPYRSFLRYPFPALPLLLVLAVLGAERIRAAIESPGARRLGTFVVLVLLSFQAAWAARPLPSSYRSPLPLTARLAAGAERFLAQDREPHDVQGWRVPLGLHSLAAWLRAHAKEGELATMAEVGIVPYYSPVRVLDTSGLVTAHIAHLPGRHGEKGDPDFVFAQEPDYFVFKKRSDCLCGGIPADVALFRDPRLRRGYDLVRMFGDGGRTILLFHKKPAASRLRIAQDLCAGYSRERVRVRNTGGDRIDRPDLGGLTGRGSISLFGEAELAPLRERLRPAMRGETADYADASLMSTWLSQWGCYNLHLPAGPQESLRIEHRLTVPKRARLSFRAGFPLDARNLPEAPDVSFRVELEDTGGQIATLFSESFGPSPTSAVWRQADVDLGIHAGQEVSLSLVVDQPGGDGVRTIFNAGWVDMIVHEDRE